jgi:AraC family transcriptional regulator
MKYHRIVLETKNFPMSRRLIPISQDRNSQTLETGGFVLTETTRSPGLVLSRHSHEHTNIALVLRGSFIETVNERPCEVNSCSLILRPAGEPHANRYNSAEARCLIIEVQPARLEMIRGFSPVLDKATHIKEPWVLAHARRLHHEFRIRDGVSALAIEGLVLDLLASAQRHRVQTQTEVEPHWLRQARDFIREEFSQPFSLSRVADAVGIHPAHLARTFRRRYRCTLGEYVRRLKLDHAAAELSETDKPLAEIALICGFYDQSHFSRAFKDYHGVTPSEFRSSRSEGRTRKRRSYKTA